MKSTIRTFAVTALLGLAPAACTMVPQGDAPKQAVEAAPNVKIEGNDGTVMNGQLLNGSVTIACGQGELMLLTDRIYSISFAKEGDSVMSDSIKVFGKIEDPELRLKTDHGVFRLQKQNLRSVIFLDATPPAVAAADPATAGGYAAATPGHVAP